MLSDTTAFVTGASGGIGREIAETVADHGANVALAARSDGIHETADRIGDDERTLAVETDVTVNAVLPGPVRGDRIEEVIEKQAELAAVEDAEPANIGPNDFALDEFTVPPEDVAEQVAYLAGPNGRNVTAQEIGVDSGGTWYRYCRL